jgi:hypothetical protein
LSFITKSYPNPSGFVLTVFVISDKRLKKRFSWRVFKNAVCLTLSSRKVVVFKKPKGCPKSSSLDDSFKEKVLKIQRRYEWGPNKIAGLLKHKGLNI